MGCRLHCWVDGLELRDDRFTTSAGTSEMLFAFSIGSAGTGSERFVLYVPFSLSPGKEISNIDPSETYEVNGHSLRLEKLNHFYALSIGPFDTEDEARRFFPKLWSCFLWISLKDLTGISYPKSLSDVTIFDQPIPVPEENIITQIAQTVGWAYTEGHYDADKAVLRPEAKKLLRVEMGRASLTVGLGTDRLIQRISEALSLKAPEKVILRRQVR